VLPPSSGPGLPATAPWSDVAPPATTLRLRLHNGRVFELKGKTSYLIGRLDEANNIYPDLDLTPYGGVEGGVSRAHAAIHVRPDGYFVEDLKSTNETLLNYHRLLPRQAYPLHDQDQLRLGGLAVLVIIS
jgi:pSer/pThr/pTyr-binding forkhead associated (FHA) protein